MIHASKKNINEVTVTNILLVEDEKVLRDAYAILLSSQGGYSVQVASNGKDALDLLKNNSYDLILLDLMMPVLDGIGFLKDAMLSEKAPNTRVIVLSNLSGGQEVKEAMRLGAHKSAVKSDLGPGDVMALVRQEIDNLAQG